MKKLILWGLLLIIGLSASYAQHRTERTGYEGDYFSLEGALDLFKQSTSLRDFERRLNTRDNWVNNLDLNYDGRTDYIRVEHRRDGNFHAIILQALVDRYDIQDVAVIEIEVIRRGEAVLQIIGDEDLYGQEVYVEPLEGYSDSRSGYDRDYGDYVNVYYWRPVQYILGRQYRVYSSPYYWHYYPTWWNPWRPYAWDVFRPRIVVYVNYYRIVPRLRVVRVHNFYRPYRSYCNPVVQRANEVRVSHGRAPIHRPEPNYQRGRVSGRDQERENVVERSRTDARNDARVQDSSVSRKRTPSTTEQAEGRNSTSRNDRGDYGSVSNPGRARTTDGADTPRQSPSVEKRNTPTYEQKRDRTTVPDVSRPSRNTSTQPSTTSRSSDSGRTSTGTKERITTRPESSGSTPSRVNQPSRNQTSRSSDSGRISTGSREQISTRSASGRSTSPSVSQPSRNQTSRSSSSTNSGARTRSTTTERKPSVSTQKSTPARSSDTKSSSSRSRRGGGE